MTRTMPLLPTGNTAPGQADLFAGLGGTDAAGRFHAGTMRPGEPRFDPVAWRQTTAARPADAMHDAARPTALAPVARRSTLALWAALGVVSAGYLGTSLWPRGQGLEAALVPVTESLERLASDIADLKQTTAALDTRGRATAARVAATETRLDGFAQTAASLPLASAPAAQGQRPTNRAVLAETPAPAPVSEPVRYVLDAVEQPKPVRTAAVATSSTSGGAGSPAAQVPAAAAAVVAVKPAVVAIAPPLPAKPTPAAPASAPPVQQAAAAAAGAVAATNPIRTGSLASAPVAAAARPAGLLIASGPSLESVRLSWSVLNQKHSSVLGALEPRILPATDGSAFHLIAGPFATDADALSACATLKTRGVGCKPAQYTGAGL